MTYPNITQEDKNIIAPYLGMLNLWQKGIGINLQPNEKQDIYTFFKAFTGRTTDLNCGNCVIDMLNEVCLYLKDNGLLNFNHSKPEEQEPEQPSILFEGIKQEGEPKSKRKRNK